MDNDSIVKRLIMFASEKHQHVGTIMSEFIDITLEKEKAHETCYNMFASQRYKNPNSCYDCINEQAFNELVRKYETPQCTQ